MFERNSKKTKENKKNKSDVSVNVENSLVESRPVRKMVRIIGEVDKPFMILTLVLIGIGVIAVASSSYSYAEANHGESYYFTKNHIMYVLLGIVAMFAASLLDYRVYKKLSKVIYCIAFCLCVAVFIPGLGHTSGGATRWLNLGIKFQPSEILKFAVIVACAKYAADAKEKIKGFKCLGFYVLILGFSAGILVPQPHLSCIIILCALVFCMMVMGGVRWTYLFTGMGLVGAAGVAVINLLPKLSFLSHASSRLAVWFDPFDPLYFKNDGWQPAQSLFAIASGGIWGVGLGQSNQKDGYIPEPQNDYIFSVICEEMGFIGAVAIMLVFAALIWRGMYIAKRAPTVFSGLLVAGIVCQIGIQTLLNIAVVSNTLPSTGISLPFLSYGGTSLVILMAQAGIVLSVSRHSIVEQE